MSFKIYTKTGDKGNTSLIGGTKVPKSHLRIEAYGTVDELNAHVGLCRDLLTDTVNKATLLEIQDRLFTIGSSLACDPIKEPRMRLPDLKESDVIVLEKRNRSHVSNYSTDEIIYLTRRSCDCVATAYNTLCMQARRKVLCEAGIGKP